MAPKTKPSKELTWEQKKKILLTPCKTKAELQKWIQHFLNLDLPSETVSRHATTNPLNVIWEIYDICVNKNNPEKVQELLYVASRGAGKTLGAAIAEFMIMLHDNRDIAHVGAIMAQAGRAYDYIQGFCVAPRVKEIINPADRPDVDKILQKSTMEKSVFEINGEKCTMEILPTTLKALNGVHASLISCVAGDTQIFVKDETGSYFLSAADLCQSPSNKAILSYNHEAGSFEYKPLIATKRMGIKTCLHITLDSGETLTCTPDHLIWSVSKQSYVQASRLEEEEELLIEP